MSKIVSISEFHERKGGYGRESGFEVLLDDGKRVTLAIGDYQDCCEEWGYFLTEDDADKFVGAELLNVYVTDTALTNRSVPPEGGGLDGGDVMFVNLDTDRGKLQFVAYNAHNGFYGHTARVASDWVTHEADL